MMLKGLNGPDFGPTSQHKQWLKNSGNRVLTGLTSAQLPNIDKKNAKAIESVLTGLTSAQLPNVRSEWQPQYSARS